MSAAPETDAASPGPLQLATMDELLQEMGRRHTAVVLITEKLSEKKATDTSDRSVCWIGGWTMSLGLIVYAHAVVTEKLRRGAARTVDEYEADAGPET